MAGMLAGQTAIISGGLGDIGRAIALELARRGADVAIGDVAPPFKAEALLTELRAMGVQAQYDHADVSDPAAVAQWLREVEADLGVPTLIIPNAAIATRAGSRDISPEDWSRELNINLGGAFNLAQAGALRLLEAKRPGRIVFLGSWAAGTPHPGIVTYCVAKAGVRMLCKCMALELAPYGILVNEVAPGYVDAGLTGQVFDAEPGLRDKTRQAVPTQQLIEAHDVALQVAYLCDPANRHMTGSALLMDGGLSLKSV